MCSTPSWCAWCSNLGGLKCLSKFGTNKKKHKKINYPILLIIKKRIIFKILWIFWYFMDRFHIFYRSFSVFFRNRFLIFMDYSLDRFSQFMTCFMKFWYFWLLKFTKRRDHMAVFHGSLVVFYLKKNIFPFLPWTFE